LEITYIGGQPSKPTVPPSTTPTTPSSPTNTTPVTPGEDNYDGTYYDSLNMNQSANGLLGDLRDLIVDTHTKYTSYDDCAAGTSNVQKADGDPNNSSNVIMFYCKRSMPNTKNYDVWNREHVWPKSTGLWQTSGGGSDLHHIRPTISSINGTRGNKEFGEVTGGKEVSANGYVGGHYLDNVFEPIDAAKGDVARIIMYMFVHYNSPTTLENNTNKSGTVNTTESSQTSGNLPLTNVIAGTKAEAFELILKWHNEDPVDASEIQRNEAVYKIQGNRNPFIDIPSLADYIWG
jgi:endonuclease I